MRGVMYMKGDSTFSFYTSRLSNNRVSQNTLCFRAQKEISRKTLENQYIFKILRKYWSEAQYL